MGRPKGGGGDARVKLLEAAGRGFRLGGFGGIGVDGLAKEAGLTSGAFYAHFGSKSDAFRLAVEACLESLREGIEAFQKQHGKAWLVPFVEFYFGARLAAPLNDACALPTFSTDVARADEATRAIYTRELGVIAALIADGLEGRGRRKRAWQLLAVLLGSSAMARAVTDSTIRESIITAVKALAKGG